MSKLVLGGHSFISQLGTDPAPDRAEAARIVAACLDAGINTFDTTYKEERLALAQALRDCDRALDAEITAWNFFQDSSDDGELAEPEEWAQDYFDEVCEQLDTDYISMLVLHPLLDPGANERQEALAQDWLDQGLVGSLATWVPPRDRIKASPAPYSAMVYPCNPANRRHLDIFPLAHMYAWETWACSPFVRGLDLDRAVEASGESRDTLAPDLLRYACHTTNVDRLIVSMRHHSLITANRSAEEAGPIPSERRKQLEQWLKPEADG